MSLRTMRAPLAAFAAMLICSVVCEASFVITPTNYQNGAATPVNWTWNVNAWKGNYNDGNDNQLPTALQGQGLVTLFKYTPKGSLYDGPYASSYTATTPVVGLPDASGLIEWEGDAYIASSVKYLLLKDGNLDDYVFNISGWNGQDDLLFKDFWGGNQGKLSHVSILGFEPEPGGFTAVPEPASIFAWCGFAATFFAGRRVRRNQKKA